VPFCCAASFCHGILKRATDDYLQDYDNKELGLYSTGAEGNGRKMMVKELVITMLFNTLIAFFLTGVGFGYGLRVNFIFSQTIGILTSLAIRGAFRCTRQLAIPIQLAAVFLAMVIGVAAGIGLGSLALGRLPHSMAASDWAIMAKMLLFGLLFASMVTYVFVSVAKMRAAEADIREERLRRLGREKEVTETRLRLLQAQIEPHFLFNTLANVLTLLDVDREKGKSMLLDLTRYLRITLDRTRREATTLGQEIEALTAYLNIYKIRMGERLSFRIDLPASLAAAPFPPLLLQPLVENAIRHGLEPRIEGGELRVAVEDLRDRLRIEVADTGKGMADTGSGGGVGLANVRERLASLYGGRAVLQIMENRPRGVKILVEVPHEPAEGNCR